MLLVPAVGQAPHEQAAADAAHQDQREHGRDVPLREVAVEAQVQLQVLHGPAHGADGGHAAHREQVEGGPPHDGQERSAGARRGRSQPGRLADQEGAGQRDHDHDHAQRAQRAPPAQPLRELVGQEGHQRAAHADAEVGNAHGLAARAVEPAREQHLRGQGAAAHVAQRVEEVEEVEGAQGGGAAQADQGQAGRGHAEDHQPPRPQPVDEDPGQQAEEGPHQELAVRVAGGDLLARPAQLAHEEVVERQPVGCASHDGEEGEEGGPDGDALLLRQPRRRGVAHAERAALAWRRRSASGCAV